MKTPIKVGDVFDVARDGRVDRFRREPNALHPLHAEEPYRITHLACSMDTKLRPYTFEQGEMWFTVRGLHVQP